MTEGWGGLSGNDDDQPDEPAPARTVQQERADVVAWLIGSNGNIPALSHFASLVSGNRMPDMSGDHRNRLRPHVREQFDRLMQELGIAVSTGQHEGASDDD